VLQSGDDPLRPYAGPSAKGVDASTLAGKRMVGYQGWFSAEGDGGSPNDVPSGKFVGYEGLPSDFYLKLAGAGARFLRGEMSAGDELPR
jgi:hypothetical protein